MQGAIGWLARAGCVAGLAFTTGCASHIAPHTVTVSMAETMADAAGVYPSVEVHLVALDPLDSRVFERMAVSDYFNPNRRMTRLDKHLMAFGGQKADTLILQRNDPIWRRWDISGAADLFTLADLPGVQPAGNQLRDPRREVVPLHRSRWWFPRKQNLKFMLDRNGIYYVGPKKYRRQQPLENY